MKFGEFEIEQLSEGIFEVHNEDIFHKVHAKNSTTKEIRSNADSTSARLGIDPILICNGKQNILLDTGLGWELDYGSTHKNSSNLKTVLDIFDLTPYDITHVVLSHLHFDHAAGCTYVDSHSKTQATLPNAHYFVLTIVTMIYIPSCSNTSERIHSEVFASLDPK